MPETNKIPFDLKGVYVAAVSYTETGEVRKFRVLENVWVNIVPGAWPEVNKAGDGFAKGARIDIKGVQINGVTGKLETGWLAANVVFAYDGLKPGRKRVVTEVEE